ncbi:CDP-glycerol glycerophosphotransferase family protein [Pseudobutyrivibrio sp. MD2005]|uniref:CDP-glycerol glycerophosphotransferase family protein n=1 Tax=Pseudobutyrivibrio sp. MD2005 TaxID=1410616 RepID=UPI000686C038|nr:CDP-glycerol glycerophosphotransferase family protein [Pseudobutyrivibrio sp. MD2005]
MADFKLHTPVVFIIFNRPDCVKDSFESIRAAKPKKLYIVADGPRFDHPDDKKLCKECRDIVSNIDWDCQVKRIYSDVNMGCGRRPATGITEVLKKEEYAIIIEDDCVPSPDFYRFCQEMLFKYKNDDRIFSISGMNFGLSDKSADYFFTYINCTWGWATWKRVWDKYDYEMSKYPEIVKTDYLYSLFNDRLVANFWYKWFDECYSQSMTSSWDHQFLFASFLEKGLHLYPNKNLVQYMGFNEDATHCNAVDSNSRLATTTNKIEKLNFPLVHPIAVQRNESLEKIRVEDIFFASNNVNQFQTFINNNINAIKASKRIILYGAGNWGRQFSLELLERGVSKFEFFVSKRQIRETVLGKTIFELNHYEVKKGDMFILSVAEAHREGMKKNLKEKGIDDYVVLKSDSEIIKNRYESQPLDTKKILLITTVAYSGHAKNIIKKILEIRLDISVGWFESNLTDESMAHVEKISQDNREKYYEYFYGAKYIITDTGCKILREGQIKIQIKHWSSVTLKMFGYDELKYRGEQDIDKYGVHGWDNIDYLLVGSEFDEKTCRSGFKYTGPAIHVGSPRSDILFDNEYDYSEVIKNYSLENNKKYVLYAPTFRIKEPGSIDGIFENELDFSVLKAALDKKFGGDWNILLRLHPFVAKQSKLIPKPDYVIDVSDYYDAEELVGISDALITDYSSIMFEPAYVKKPVFLFAPDKEKYLTEERGFYINYNELPFPVAETNDTLSENIGKFDSQKYTADLNDFLNKYGVHEDGKASERAARFIISLIDRKGN